MVEGEAPDIEIVILPFSKAAEHLLIDSFVLEQPEDSLRRENIPIHKIFGLDVFNDLGVVCRTEDVVE